MTSTFSLREVAAGVWAAVAPGITGLAVSNAAIIDTGAETIVVDTFMTRIAATELREEALRLTGRETTLVVNSHWHSDHVRGNQAFAHAPIIGTDRIRELIVEDSPSNRAEYDRRAAALRTIGEKLMAEARSPAEIANAAATMELVEALEVEADEYQTVLPNTIIGDRLDIEGERNVTILSYGRGHTESDLFLHLPDDAIIVAGDLVWTGMHPKTKDGYPGEWASVLDQIGELSPSRIIAGHGPPGTAADVSAMAMYMREVQTMLMAIQSGDLNPAEAPAPGGTADWDGIERFRSGLSTLAARD
ncbi:MAG: MBL fold metallo-hydrolase [Acidimicrobiia bacterium]|nr:MBL fold metallo-hydrolase [Acidimicrobiia bacterium]